MTNTNPAPLSVPKLKTWARTNRSLAMTVVTARAFYQLERERVAAYVTPIFLKYGFTDADNGAPLTDPSKLYHSDEEEKCKAFYAECRVPGRPS